ncbi:MAG: HEPN domain-containing protein [bacterium]
MPRNPEEWLKQAEYDLGTAEFMFTGGRYFYSVFMAHLSIEKALKGLYQKELNEIPPKTHNLITILNSVGLKPPDEMGKFLIKINQASVVTRYPEDLSLLQKNYTKPVVKEILDKAKDSLEWIKKMF